MATIVYAYPFTWGDIEANTKHIIDCAKSKRRSPGDTLVFALHAMTGAVHTFESLSADTKEVIEASIAKIAKATKKTGVKLVLPAMVSRGLGVHLIHDGVADVLPMFETVGGLVVLKDVLGTTHDLVFRTADVAEPFAAWSASHYVIVDSQTFHDGRVFAGQCRVVQNGKLKANYLAPDSAFDIAMAHVCRCDEATVKVQALKVALKCYLKRYGFKAVTLGLSGGLDSAVVAAIAADVVGADNVHAYVLPSRFTSEESWQDAEDLATNLGLKLQAIDIMPTVKTAFDSVTPHLPEGRSTALMAENLQARARGLLLMSLSNVDGSLVLTTGNKSECAVGYCTLYGDMVGGLALLSDIYKSELYKLCEDDDYLRRVIPKNILTKAPTAELREDQKDEDSLPPYPQLDAVLKNMIERGFSLNKLKKRHGAELAARIWKLVKGAQFKREQAAQGVKLTTKPLSQVTNNDFF
ncbi:MAG: NAD(+) synthase [Burkholderiaceae bacterium]|nr:NAD(+) synthase [Burkholderiaceae bacterium]